MRHSVLVAGVKLEIHVTNHDFVRNALLIFLEVRVETPIGKAESLQRIQEHHESGEILDEVDARALNGPLSIIIPDPGHVL
jgi:hypothetical protein